MKDLTKIKSPFGMLSKKTQDRLKVAIDAGEAVEWWSGDGWVIRHWGVFCDKVTYRLQPTQELTQDSIDWSHVSDNIVCIARDSDGGCWGYERVPTWFEGHWLNSFGVYFRMKGFASYKQGTCEAEDSLVLRPKEV